jgi:predicted N-acetyltransferase YhbS
MARDWSIREYSTRDKQGVFELRKAAYGESFDEQAWEWKFENGPLRPAQILVAEKDALIIGIRPTIFMPMKIMNEVLIAGLNVDVMTHPDFRRRGIFSTLVRESLKRLNEQGVNIAFTFPNENSYPGYVRRLRWYHVCSLPLLAKPLNIDNIVKKYFKTSLLRKPAKLMARAVISTLLSSEPSRPNGLQISTVESFDDRFNELWQRASSQYQIAVVRDKKYLNWRYIDRPGQEYTVFSAQRGTNLVGYVIVKSNVRMFDLVLGLIVDILASDDNHVADYLIAQAIEYFRGEKVDAIGCVMLKHTPYHKALKRNGFIQVPQLLSPKEFPFMVHFNSSEIPKVLAGNPVNWFLTFGDFDIA